MMANRVRARLPSRIRVALLCLIGVTMWAPAALADSLPDFDGQRLTAIRVVAESGAVLEDNPTGLALKPGQPFSIDAERETLRQLYRSGRYADLVAEVSLADGGLLLSFVAQKNYYVSRIVILGLREPPSDTQAASALGFSLGATFHESDMPTALARLQSMLDGEGLYQAKVSYQLSPHPDTRQMDVTLRVVPGPRARLGALHLVNETPFTEGDLRRRLHLKPKTEVTSERLDHGSEQTRKWLADRGYLGARVSVMRGSYDAATNQLPLEVHLFAGLKVDVLVTGANVSSRTLRRLLPIYEEGAVDDDLLQEGRRNLRDYFQGEGYFDTDVNYVTSETPAKAAPNANAGATPALAAAEAGSSETITFRVERGPRRRLVGISFTGNRYFDDNILRSRVRIQPSGFDSPGRFSSAQLASDVASLTDIYRANGFLAVHVNSDVQESYGGKSENIFVRFEVQEGPQTRVANLKLEGNKALSQSELLRVIGSASGQPFSDFNVASDRDNVLALYYDQGFPAARFTSTSETLSAAGSQQGPRVNLTYNIDEGSQLRVARVLVDGYDHTHLSVISREIQIQPGKPLSEGQVVETQRRLYNLEIFNRVSIAPQNPDGTDPDKTIDVLVEEARRYTIAYGPGLEVQRLGSASTGPVSEPLRFSPRATFEFTKLNLTGRADTLSFKARASTLQGRALLSYSYPNLFGQSKLTMLLSGLYDKTRDVLTFTSTRGEGSAQLTDRLTPSTSLLFRYVYRHVLASDLQVEPEEIPLFSQPTDVSFLSATWVRDRRDNAADPARGSYNTVDVDFASKAIGSRSSFVRATAENSTYTRIGSRLVFARSTRFGIQEPIEQTDATDIPLPERFFAGGGTTLRGFGLNQAGPRDPLTGFPIGGLGMLVFNQQLQFPMRLPWVGNRVGGAIFYDAGNVFSSVGQITFRSTPVTPIFTPGQPNICLINCNNALNYFSHTVGFEFRYHTPIGPVSIDLAYQLNAAQFLIPVGNTATCTNSATTTCLTLSRLPAFQFFVNLGSTF
jgi:outer membrane protein insertion porin family